MRILSRASSWFQSKWQELPTSAKIIVYQGLAGLLTLIQFDLAKVSYSDPYMLLLIQVTNNLIVYGLQHITKIIAQQNEER